MFYYIAKLMWRVSFISIVSLFLVYVGVSLPALTKDDHERIILEYARPSVVIVGVLGEMAGGTGFSLDFGPDSNVMITNAHVCALSSYGPLIVTSPGMDSPLAFVHIDYIDITKDLCILRSTYVPKGLPLRLYAPVLTEKVYMVGHPELRPLQVSSGYIIAPALTSNIWGFMTNAKGRPGSSGSPVMDRDGFVIGIGYAADYFNNMYMIHYIEIIRFLTDYIKARDEWQYELQQ